MLKQLYGAHGRYLANVAGVLFFVLAMFAIIFPIQDPDTFWHLAYGRSMVEQGAFINKEIYSYTARGSFLGSHSQLAQIVLYLVWCGGGIYGLLAFKMLIGAITFLLLVRIAKLLGVGTPGATALALLVILAGYSRFVERPELFSILFFSGMTLLLFGYRQGAFNARALYILPVGLVLWDYLHGALYGLVLLLLFTGGETLKKFVTSRYPNWKLWCGDILTTKRLKTLWGWTVISLIAMSLHPNGIFNYSALSRISSHTAEYAMYGEFMPPRFIAQFVWYWLLVLIVVGLAVACFRRLDLTALLVALPFMYLSLKFNRATLFFAMAAVPLMAQCSVVIQRRWASIPWWRWGQAVLAGGLLLMAPLYKQVIGPDFARFGAGLNNIAFPVGSTRFVAGANLPGNMFNSNEIGGYLAFFLGPDRKIFSYNQPGVFTAQVDYAHRPETRQQWDINYAVISDINDYNMMFRDGFVPVYREPNAIVMLKKSAMNAALLARYQVRYFDPLKAPVALEQQSRVPDVGARLCEEISVYLTYRRDQKIAALLARLLKPDNQNVSVPLEKRRLWLEAALRENGESLQLLQTAGLVAYRQRDSATAGRYFDAVLLREPSDITALMNRGYIYYDHGDYTQAKAMFARVVAEADDLPDAHYALGLTAVRINDKDMMRQEFERFLQLAPNSPLAAKARQWLSGIAP